MTATLESFSIGYAPYEAAGKCSLTYVDKLFSVDFLRVTHQRRSSPYLGIRIYIIYHISYIIYRYILYIIGGGYVHQVCLRTLQHVALDATRFLCGVIEGEARRALDVVISPIG